MPSTARFGHRLGVEILIYVFVVLLYSLFFSGVPNCIPYEAECGFSFLASRIVDF